MAGAAQVRWDQLRAVLIGAGAIAREHLAALRQLSGVAVEGVCDISPARAESTAERFGVRRWFTDYRLMVAETRPDLVHVTTPPPSHFGIVGHCLAAGHNVFCEKPITAEYAEFLELKALALEQGLMLTENQNLRFHSSVRRIHDLQRSGQLGDVVDVQVQLVLPIAAAGSRYADPNAPHPCLSMRGGPIADFLTHLAYLAYLFAGPMIDVRTLWSKRVSDSILPADEFRALVRCERATAWLSFSAGAQPPGFWLRVLGTCMQVEASLYDPPRIVARRVRRGIAPLPGLVDGLAESWAVASGTLGSLWRKLGGTSSYDGLAAIVAAVYAALAHGQPAPVPIDEVDDVARMVAALTDPGRVR